MPISSRRAPITSLLLLVTALIVACSGNSAPERAAAADTVRACQIFTNAEIADLIGGAVDTPDERHEEQASETEAWLSMCNYYSNDSGVGLGLMLRPHGYDDVGQESFDDYQRNLQEQLGEWETTPVDGIGDAAAWQPEMRDLTLFGGPYAISISLIAPELTDEQALEIAESIAVETLSRLP